MQRQDISKPQYSGETSVSISPAVIWECSLQIYSAALNSLTRLGMKDLWKRSLFHLGCLSLSLKDLLKAPTVWCRGREVFGQGSPLCYHLDGVQSIEPHLVPLRAPFWNGMMLFFFFFVESPGSNHVSLCYFSAGSVSSKRWKVEHWDIIPVWLVFQKQTLFLILNLRAEISSSLQLRFSVIDFDLD